MGSELAVCLAEALTGQQLSVSASDSRGLARQLAEQGWDAVRLAGLRAECMASHQPWPFPIDLEVRRRLGFARFDASLAELRQELGLAGTPSRAPNRVRALTADEQRLVADRPPHWG